MKTPIFSMDSRNIRNPYHGVDDLQSDFGDDVAETSRKKRRNDFMEKELPGQVKTAFR